MIKRIIVLIAFILSLLPVDAQEKALVKGMKISRSMKIKKTVYAFDASADLTKHAVLIEGDNIIIDFNNATLKGSNKQTEPDRFFGTAFIIRNSKNVTIKNLKIKGYKIALLARNVEKLTLDNCDFSYNYRQHLNSTQEKEDISDWMSYHQNEKDEWLRYGAAIYLSSCDFAEIKNCRVTGGQNALMMTLCNNGMIYNNDFSFNSGIGIGMYRSSNNKILYNKINFNVRGYSHGVYNRGQDSAGILVYEQSNKNFFYRNSVTHCGDGFFLWAGETTMDSGNGGCNDNILWKNDFSYAPTNGIEVTFSRNVIRDNRIYECDHGIWGGYSYNTLIEANKFRNNRIAIAIEHGQENQITYNVFSEDKEAVKLWGRKEQPADWGYAKNRDVRSRNYTLAFNSFNRNETVFNFSRSEDLNIFGNTYGECLQLYKIDSTVTGIDSTVSQELNIIADSDVPLTAPIIKNPADSFKGMGKYAGRKNIRMTEWGPYDFRYPLIWNTNPSETTDEMQFEILGPKGNWKIKSFRGVENISSVSGSFPATISARKIKAGDTDIRVDLEYTGEGFTTQVGDNVQAGKPYQFLFKKYFKPLDWEVLWFAMDTAIHNPLRTGNLFLPYVKLRPVKREQTNKLDYAWWGGIKDDQTKETYKQFITTASAKGEFEKGEYELSVTWDDAVRIYVDTNLIVNEWNPSLYKFDESPNKKITLKLNGTHFFRVEHLELGGFATLQLKLRKLD